MPDASLRAAWEGQAEAWARWARTPGHDHHFWEHNLPAFLDLVPPPGRLTLDAGCGEGRVGRALAERGHRVVALDGSPTLARLAATAAPPLPVGLVDLARLPVRDGAADLVVSHMVLQDVDDLDASVVELARVLAPGGTVCATVGHPVATAEFFGIPYAVEHRYESFIERDGISMTFHSVHRPLAVYGRALEAAGLAITALREPPRTPGDPATPIFLHLRAVRLGSL